ncbi:AraC family transcriptional regulator [Paraburkholderia sp.]|uniref:AraC family transcriptional regulator n=1 Tax=Paraburkholderia sp. TaxID=1926495 RepID=UPI0023827477|nr:AraC family transcriptional regulator [Paraburkholderia sp.]MDE1182144.1 AraC family transcriptional regulator [Paraburkholderia sp.]
MTSESLAYPALVVAHRAGKPAIDPVDLERQWRCPGHPDVSAALVSARLPSVTVSRWTRHDDTPIDVVNPGSDALHCVALNLKSTSLTFVHAGRTLVSGRVTAGAVQVTTPGVATGARFESSSDVLHLFVSQSVLHECYEDLFDRRHNGDLALSEARLIRDPAIERLGQALAVSQTHDAALGKVFTDSVSLAIVSRLVATQFAAAPAQSRDAAALPAWRVRRAIDYVDAHLAEPIGLAEMAESTGLTRMHFAAQFRRATGMRPHEYLLRRRIEHAQSLLRTSPHNVLDVALSCGFRSQAHFTTVFKRFTGDTPHCWRTKAHVER